MGIETSDTGCDNACNRERAQTRKPSAMLALRILIGGILGGLLGLGLMWFVEYMTLGYFVFVRVEVVQVVRIVEIGFIALCIITGGREGLQRYRERKAEARVDPPTAPRSVDGTPP